MKELVDQLKRNRTLSPEELRLLLTDASPEEREYLHRAAREVARVHFGKDRKSTRLNSSHWNKSRMPSSA